MCEIVGAIRQHYIAEKCRYSIEWANRLAPEVGAYPAVTRDRIESSVWALAANSPATGVILAEDGFEDDLSVTWVNVESDGSLVDGDIIYLENTIETSGIAAYGNLSKGTATQRLVRQIRVRFKEC